jgi:hypothetical protein
MSVLLCWPCVRLIPHAGNPNKFGFQRKFWIGTGHKAYSIKADDNTLYWVNGHISGDGSLRCSQKPVTGFLSVSVESISHPHNLFLENAFPSFQLTPTILYAFLISPMSVTHSPVWGLEHYVMFRNMLIFHWVALLVPTLPRSMKITPYRLSATLIQYTRSYPPHLAAVTKSLWGADLKTDVAVCSAGGCGRVS